MTRVLHVTDCLNAGVLKAIETITYKNQDVQHFLLWDYHKDTPYPELQLLKEYKVNLLDWSGGYFSKIFYLNRYIRVVKPNYLHLHSSLAGFLGRLFTPSKRILYSPHCFAFQRKDISRVGQLMHILIEYCLSLRTSSYIPNWPIEYDLITRYFRHSKIHFSPIINFIIEDRFIFNQSSKSVVAVGRIRPQKDPQFFIDVKKTLTNSSGITFVWIGNGDSNLKNSLAESEVFITGWSDIRTVEHYFKTANLQLITSRWESGPFTFYEALVGGIPSLLRDIPAFNQFSFEKYSTPDSMSKSMLELINDDAKRYLLYLEQISNVEEIFQKYLVTNRSQILY